jgi:hypothetical protein
METQTCVIRYLRAAAGDTQFEPMWLENLGFAEPARGGS